MLYFIINPHSRSGQGGAVWKEVERTMISSGLPYKVSYTSYPGHAIRLAAEIPSGTQPEPESDRGSRRRRKSKRGVERRASLPLHHHRLSADRLGK